jgi:hypothetical protein
MNTSQTRFIIRTGALHTQYVLACYDDDDGGGGGGGGVRTDCGVITDLIWGLSLG